MLLEDKEAAAGSEAVIAALNHTWAALGRMVFWPNEAGPKTPQLAVQKDDGPPARGGQAVFSRGLDGL